MYENWNVTHTLTIFAGFNHFRRVVIFGVAALLLLMYKQSNKDNLYFEEHKIIFVTTRQ
jgi:hypothetical protein